MHPKRTRTFTYARQPQCPQNTTTLIPDTHNSNVENRGAEPFVRVSWDKVLDLVAEELTSPAYLGQRQGLHPKPDDRKIQPGGWDEIASFKGLAEDAAVAAGDRLAAGPQSFTLFFRGYEGAPVFSVVGREKQLPLPLVPCNECHQPDPLVRIGLKQMRKPSRTVTRGALTVKRDAVPIK